jgi:hypothetical protein
MGDIHTTAWAHEEDTIILDMLKEGRTASEISCEINSQFRARPFKRSRNSVIGRISRMGFRNGIKKKDPPRVRVKEPKPPKPAPLPRSGGEARTKKLSELFPVKKIETWREKAEHRAIAHIQREEVLERIEEWATPTGEGIPFMRRGIFQCAWMSGTGYKATVCGKPVASRYDRKPSSYCPEHHDLCYAKVTPYNRGPVRVRDANVIEVKVAAGDDEDAVADELVPVDDMLAGDDDEAEAA